MTHACPPSRLPPLLEPLEPRLLLSGADYPLLFSGGGDTILVGDPGNVGEASGGATGSGPARICGAVAYPYMIGKYEVTAGQYTAFLNAVAVTDTYGLYNTTMWSSNYGCKIQRSGSSGIYTYSVASDRANRPVTSVSFWDACRFANWLHNGQPSGVQDATTTEAGAYTLNGYTGVGGSCITRNAEAKWFIPSEDEWYKAAYYDPALNGGTGGYWDYATRSNTVPVSQSPPGGANSANWSPTSAGARGPTNVGAYSLSRSAYGTFDQSGNAWEWHETVVTASHRGLRGSSFEFSPSTYMAAAWRNYYDPNLEYYYLGFRVACCPSDAGDSLSSATSLGALSSGTPVTRAGQVGDGAYASKDVDLYKFTVPTAGSVTLDVDAQSIGSGLDAYLRLFNASGQEIDKNDDTHGRDPYLSVVLSPGTYYVGVSGYANRYYNPNSGGSGVAGSTGAYTLRVSLAGSGGGVWAPVITASAEYDGNTDPAVFGRYLTGGVVPDVLNTFTVYVTPPSGYTTSAVVFDSDFDGDIVPDAGDYVDSTGGDGWIWNLNVSRLEGDKTLKVWAQESGGKWSSPATFTVDTLSLPAWVDLDPDKTTIAFDTGSQEYTFRSLIGQRIGVDTPSSWPSWLAFRDGKPTFNGRVLRDACRG